MKVTHIAAYDAPLAEVYAMLTDPAFREQAAAATGVISAEVTIEPQGQGHVVTVDQVQPTDGVPSFARKFAGETTRVIQVERWSGTSEGTLVVQTPGRPAELSGSYRLEETGGRTVQSFAGELRVKVPLVGGRLEKLMADLFRAGRDKEQAAGAAWLRGQRG